MGGSRLTQKIIRWLGWRLSLPLLLLNGWCLLILFQYFKTPITVFVVGAVLAFLLQHPLQWLERIGVRRGLATLLVLLSTFLVFSLIGAILVPILIQQANQLTGSLADWAKSAETQAQFLHNWAMSRGIPIDFNSAAAGLFSHISSEVQVVVSRIPALVLGAVGGLFEIVLTTVTTIYLLIKGEQLWNGVLSWLPSRLGCRIRTTLPRSFRNYFIGQGTVALLLGSLMIAAFLLFRIPFGVLFGAFIGAMALFPYGGSISIVLVAILVSFKSIGLGTSVLLIATVVDQIVENGVAPRLLGELTGVHPVWVLITLLIGGKVAGVLGFFLAVPLASFVKSMAELYRQPVVAEPNPIQ
jgi:predicted PurR-regulated permease PerM